MISFCELLLRSGKGCGLWLWHSLDFSLTFFFHIIPWKMKIYSFLLYFKSFACKEKKVTNNSWLTLSNEIKTRQVILRYTVYLGWLFRAATWENVLSSICTHRWFKSVLASSRSNQSYRSPHQETLTPWLYTICRGKILIRLLKSTGCSESFLGAHDIWRCGSIQKESLNNLITLLLESTSDEFQKLVQSNVEWGSLS